MFLYKAEPVLMICFLVALVAGYEEVPPDAVPEGEKDPTKTMPVKIKKLPT